MTPRSREIIKKRIKQNPHKAHLLVQVINLFLQDPFHPLLKTHKLKGKLSSCYAFTVEYDLRIIFILKTILMQYFSL
jgi:mRNA interferase YafQ